jgi:hypothetical protein
MLLADGGGLTSRPKRATVLAPVSPLKKPSDSITGKKYSSSSSSGSANAAEYRAEKQRAAAKRASDYAASQRPQSRPASKPSGESLRVAEHRTEAAARRASDYAASQRPQSRPASKPFEGSVRAAEHRADEKRAAAQRASDYAASQRPQSRPASKPSGESLRVAEHRTEAAARRASDYAASQRPQSRPASKPLEGSVRAAEHRADEKRAAAQVEQEVNRRMANQPNVGSSVVEGAIRNGIRKDVLKEQRAAAQVEQEIDRRTSNQPNVGSSVVESAMRNGIEADVRNKALREDPDYRAFRASQTELAIQDATRAKREQQQTLAKAKAAEKQEESKGWFEKAVDATKEVAEDAWENKGEIGHGILDVVGVIDPTGIADGINAGWYLAEGDGVNAALSAAGMIPYVGDLAKVGKYGVKAAKAGEEVVAAGAKATNKAVKEYPTNVRGPLRDPVTGRFKENPSSLTNESKHHTPEYRAAQDRLKIETINDDKAPKYMKDWLKQEQRNRGNNPRNWRNPKGHDTGHPIWQPKDSNELILRWETSRQNRSRGAKYGK